MDPYIRLKGVNTQRPSGLPHLGNLRILQDQADYLTSKAAQAMGEQDLSREANHHDDVSGSLQVVDGGDRRQDHQEDQVGHERRVQEEDPQLQMVGSSACGAENRDIQAENVCCTHIILASHAVSVI